MKPIVVDDENEDLKIEDSAEEDGTFDEGEMEPVSDEEWAEILSLDFDALSLADENSDLYGNFDEFEDGEDDEEEWF